MSKESEELDLPEEIFEPDRKHLDIQVDGLVQCSENIYRITQILDFESVIGVHVETGRSASLRIGDLRPLISDDLNMPVVDILEIADEDWQIAQQRFAAIKPLVNQFGYGRAGVEERAKESGVDTATLYRWLKLYNLYGSVDALVPKKRGWKSGKGRIPIHAEKVIEEVIQNYYLTKQRSKPQKAIIEVLRLCQQRGIEPPSKNTIRSRINRVSEKEQLRRRGHKEKAKNKFIPTPGTFPNADFPLAVIEVDHTPADIILVDDVHRKPIGRPYITLAMDIYSRMITGYYLSFDPPSVTSNAMCLSQSILPKEEWLLLHNVESDWPVWGVPKTIHVDNGADFVSGDFQNSCLIYGINLEYRPPGLPNYGGHIERGLGTLLTEIHDLPGTTFSSVKAKDGYDSEKHAAMTKTEFEEWLVTFICNVYHKRMHSGIGMTPLRKWEIGVFGNAETTGVGVPPRPVDRHTILLDFLPSYRRTVQAFGVTIDKMTYYSEVLRPWINAADPDKPGKKLKVLFRRDQRDISTIWFFDPDLKQYFKVPFADQRLPPMSIWEYQQAKDKLKAEGKNSVNIHQVLDAITDLRDKVENSKENTKKARRQAQRRKEHEKKVTPDNPLKKALIEKKSIISNVSGLELLDGDIEPYGDIT